MAGTLSYCGANAQLRTIELKPIQKQGWQYFYDFKRVSTPEALQIPLQGMEDDQINKHYKAFETLQFASDLVSLAPLCYFFVVLNSQPDFNQFWYVVGGSVAVSLGLHVWSHRRMRLAIDRYNELLLPHPSGRNRSQSVGLTFAVKL